MLILVKLSNSLYISLSAVLPTRFVIEPINSFFFCDFSFEKVCIINGYLYICSVSPRQAS